MALGEFELIRRYFTRHSQRHDVLLGVGDDAAILAVPADRRLVVTVDTSIEGVHFPPGTSAFDIGYRCLAVNLSDLAAMGAQPAWITLSLSLPEADAQWLEGFAAGLFQLADAHNVALVGGDTVRGPLSVTIEAMGFVEADGWLTRSGAKPGDCLYVSGIPGEAAAGLDVIQRRLPQGAAVQLLAQRFLHPQPRLKLGRQLRTIACAAMDISDGLLIDLDKLCAASHCGARIELKSLPQSPAMQELFDATQCERFALAGGDDYELLFAVSHEKQSALKALSPDVAITRIGTLTQGGGVGCYRDNEPVNIAQRGFDHFGQRS